MPLGGLRNHPTGIETRWTWLKENWDEIFKRLPPSLGMLGTVVQLTTSSFCTEAQLKDVQEFFAAKDTKVRLFPSACSTNTSRLFLCIFDIIIANISSFRATTVPSSRVSTPSAPRSTGSSATARTSSPGSLRTSTSRASCKDISLWRIGESFLDCNIISGFTKHSGTQVVSFRTVGYSS